MHYVNMYYLATRKHVGWSDMIWLKHMAELNYSIYCSNIVYLQFWNSHIMLG